MEKHEFVRAVFSHARRNGHTCCVNRDGLNQIEFSNKSLHEKHIEQLYPSALRESQDLNQLIDAIAPGRPCTHAPMKRIIEAIRAENA